MCGDIFSTPKRCLPKSPGSRFILKDFWGQKKDALDAFNLLIGKNSAKSFEIEIDESHRK